MFSLFGKKAAKPAAAAVSAPTTIYQIQVGVKSGKLDIKLKKEDETEFRTPSFLSSTAVQESSMQANVSVNIPVPETTNSKKPDEKYTIAALENTGASAPRINKSNTSALPLTMKNISNNSFVGGKKNKN